MCLPIAKHKRQKELIKLQVRLVILTGINFESIHSSVGSAYENYTMRLWLIDQLMLKLKKIYKIAHLWL